MLLHQLIVEKAYAKIGEFLYPAVKGLLTSPPTELNKTDENGNTPIHIAAQLGDIKSVELLLAAAPLLDIKNKNGEFAKDLSASPEIQQKLIDAELLVAAWYGDLKTVKTLVEYSNGEPAKLVAIRVGFNADIFRSDAYYCAKFKNQQHILQYFCYIHCKRARASINYSNETLFAQKDAIKTAEEAIEKQAAKPYIDSDFGLFEAIEKEDIFAIKGLVKWYNHKVNESVLLRKYSLTPTAFCFAVSCEKIMVIRTLIELGGDFNDEEVLKIANLSQQVEIRALFNLPPCDVGSRHHFLAARCG